MQLQFIKRNLLWLIIVTVVFILLYLNASSVVDPDYYWHLRHGREILRFGLIFHDQYSYTMPSFPFVDHSWVTSVIWSLIYDTGMGYQGLAVFCSAITVLGIIIAANQLIWLIPLLGSITLYMHGVRSHIVSFLMFSLLLFIYQKYEKGTEKAIYLIPILMFLWANLHGGFAIGTIYIWGYFFVEVLLLKRKTESLRKKILLFIISIVAFIVTFGTPYLSDTWAEVIRTANNPLLRTYISEWQPMTRLTSFSIPLFIVLFIISIKYTRKIRWIEIFTVLMLIDAIISVRMIAFFGTAATFVISRAFLQFKEDKNLKVDQKRLGIIITFFSIGLTLLFVLESFLNLRARLHINETLQPTLGATQFLKETRYSGNIFSVTNWNSYLELDNPERKIFLDGRMVVWSQKAVQNELDSAFQTYIDIAVLEKPYQEVFDRFCIGTVLWYNPTIKENWITHRVSPHFIKQIQEDGWIKTYEDPISVIYERPLPSQCNFS